MGPSSTSRCIQDLWLPSITQPTPDKSFVHRMANTQTHRKLFLTGRDTEPGQVV